MNDSSVQTHPDPDTDTHVVIETSAPCTVTVLVPVVAVVVAVTVLSVKYQQCRPHVRCQFSYAVLVEVTLVVTVGIER